jgi:hypothetical protein
MLLPKILVSTRRRAFSHRGDVHRPIFRHPRRSGGKLSHATLDDELTFRSRFDGTHFNPSSGHIARDTNRLQLKLMVKTRTRPFGKAFESEITHCER